MLVIQEVRSGKLGSHSWSYLGHLTGILYYFILTGVTQDGYATSVFLPDALSFMNVREGHFMNRFFQNTEITFSKAGVPGNRMVKYNGFTKTPNMQLAKESGLDVGGWIEVRGAQRLEEEPKIPPQFQGGTQTMTKHPYDDSNFMWDFILAMLMDWAFISFCFNMLPIITLDGADFFGSWVRLCSTPVVSAVFIIVTSFICIIGLLIWQFVCPLVNIIDKWDTYKAEQEANKQSVWMHKQVMSFALVSLMILMKLGHLISPTIKLICNTCKDKLYKYHFTQDHEGKARNSSMKRAYGHQPNVVIHPRPNDGYYAHQQGYPHVPQPQAGYHQYGRAIDY